MLPAASTGGASPGRLEAGDVSDVEADATGSALVASPEPGAVRGLVAHAIAASSKNVDNAPRIALTVRPLTPSSKRFLKNIRKPSRRKNAWEPPFSSIWTPCRYSESDTLLGNRDIIVPTFRELLDNSGAFRINLTCAS